MSTPCLIIDPGHGGKDKGGGSNDSFLEKDLNLKISLYQYNRFKKLGVPVSITRKEDIYLSPSERTKLVRESNAKYCISNHINAASSSNVRGVETIHSIFSGGELARVLYDALVEMGMEKRRVFSKESTSLPGKDYYYMHRDTGRVITTIIEYGFATNREDSILLKGNWSEYAEGVVKCLCEYAGYNYVMQEEEQINEKFPQVKEKIKILYEGKEIAAYITTENKSIAEVKILCELLGYNVSWDSENKTVIIKKGQ